MKEKMYAILCFAISEALDALPFLPENTRARWLLEKAMQDELYLAEDENTDGDQ